MSATAEVQVAERAPSTALALIPANLPVRTTLSMRELARESVALDYLVDMDEGEWTEAHEALATELAAQLVPKVDAFCDFVNDQAARAAALKAEADRLNARASTLTKQVDWLKSYAVEVLTTMDRDKIKGERWTLAKQKNSTPTCVVEVLPAALPAAYVRVIPEVLEVNKTAIVAALKAGEEIEGCRLSYGFHVRTR